MLASDFIAKIASYAVADMLNTRIPASLTIAQAILESNWGESGLTKQGNNLFGIKGVGTAGSGEYRTAEYNPDGSKYYIMAKFRHYNNWGESIADHSKLILNGTRDKPTRYHGVLGADYKTAAHAIRAGGYATDPNYPNLLISLIEKYELYKYDEEGVEEGMTTAEKEAFEKLQKIVEVQAKRIEELEAKASLKEIPSWALEACKAAKSKKINGQSIVDTTAGGSLDFYRNVTVLHRLGMFN